MITGKHTKKKTDSVADTLATAAVAIIKALKDPSPPAPGPAVDSNSKKDPQDIMSPTKKVNLQYDHI